jgi:hypothetical protein
MMVRVHDKGLERLFKAVNMIGIEGPSLFKQSVLRFAVLIALGAAPVPGLMQAALAQGPSAQGTPRVAQGGGAGFQVAAPAPSAGTTVRPGDIPGRYYIYRDGGKDTGCMLTLDDKIRVKGGNRAVLAPACRDQGIVIFDPAAWALVGGRLVLTARKGHATHLDHQADGSWLKDPKEGKSLSLKKM